MRGGEVRRMDPFGVVEFNSVWLKLKVTGRKLTDMPLCEARPWVECQQREPLSLARWDRRPHGPGALLTFGDPESAAHGARSAIADVPFTKI